MTFLLVKTVLYILLSIIHSFIDCIFSPISQFKAKNKIQNSNRFININLISNFVKFRNKIDILNFYIVIRTANISKIVNFLKKKYLVKDIL